MRRADFEIVFFDSFTSVLLSAMAVSRLARRKAGELRAANEEVIETEFKLSPWLNSTHRMPFRPSTHFAASECASPSADRG